MSKPEPEALRDAARVQGSPVLDYARRGGGRADGERPRATAGHVLAALIVAGLAFVGALVGGMALATLLPDDGSDQTLFVAARVRRLRGPGSCAGLPPPGDRIGRIFGGRSDFP